MTPPPAALVLADHQPVYVVATTQPAAKVRCCCGDWEGAWCDYPIHQAQVLAGAGLVTDRVPAETPTARVLAERGEVMATWTMSGPTANPAFLGKCMSLCMRAHCATCGAHVRLNDRCFSDPSHEVEPRQFGGL